MSTNPQNKRVTKQVRISEHLHRRIKLEAVREGKTMSKLIDEIIEKYLTRKDESQKH